MLLGKLSNTTKRIFFDKLTKKNNGIEVFPPPPDYDSMCSKTDLTQIFTRKKSFSSNF